MKRIAIIFILAFLNIVGMNAQTDFFYSINGEREIFNVRKDRVVLRTNSKEEARTVSAQAVFRATRTVGYDMVIATIDSLSVALENLRQIPNVADVAFALEYADGTVQMPTNRIFVQFRDGQYPLARTSSSVPM